MDATPFFEKFRLKSGRMAPPGGSTPWPGCGSRRCGTRGFLQGDATERPWEDLAIAVILD